MRKYAEDKTVMYCNSVGKMQTLAEALGYDGYYYAAREKEARLRIFMTG
jgi:hypothetical protein